MGITYLTPKIVSNFFLKKVGYSKLNYENNFLFFFCFQIHLFA